LILSTPWTQAYLGTIVCKFGGDSVIACKRSGNYSADRQTDTTYHEPFFQNPAKSWELHDPNQARSQRGGGAWVNVPTGMD